MDLKLQIVFILASVGTIIFVIRQIRKYGLNIEDSVTWILWSMMLLILSLFPAVADGIAKFLGFMSTSNFILSLFVFYLYIALVMQMIQISKLKEKEKELIQKLSIAKAELEETTDKERKTK